MIYHEFKGKQLSLLGFGAMRLPTNTDGSVDEEQVREMTRYAIENGVNYFDTAYSYHNNDSEPIMGRVLREYPRDSFYLATKYPGHQLMSNGYNPAEIFEEQLRNCGVDYFDFYLLHNVYEKSMDVYLDPKWNIVGYFKEQKRLGRIKHLGFSTHAQVEGLEQFLDLCGEDMEFCQIQLNYLDWTLQDAKTKYELLTGRGIPVWVMEPVRGGKLSRLSEEDERKLKELRPDESVSAWGFRFLQGLPNVGMILSGMSNLAQMEDNVKTFSQALPLHDQERELVLEIAEGMKSSVPCTACRYCCNDCPMGLDIPLLLSIYNEIKVVPSVNAVMNIQFMEDNKKPAACIACGKCTKICPQNIDVPNILRDLSRRVEKIPSWADICLEREEAARRHR